MLLAFLGRQRPLEVFLSLALPQAPSRLLDAGVRGAVYFCGLGVPTPLLTPS